MIPAANSICARRLRATLGSAVVVLLCSLTAAPAAAVGTEDPAACLRRLERALDRRGFTLELHEIGPSDGPSVVDALDAILRDEEPGATLTIVLRGTSAHVRAPFLGYREARALVGRAARSGRPMACALGTEVLIAAQEEDRLRVPLLLVLFGALGAAWWLLRGDRAQNAK